MRAAAFSDAANGGGSLAFVFRHALLALVVAAGGAAAEDTAPAQGTASSSDGGGVLDSSGSTTGAIAEAAAGLDTAVEEAGFIALATLGAASCAMMIYVCKSHSHPPFCSYLLDLRREIACGCRRLLREAQPMVLRPRAPG